MGTATQGKAERIGGGSMDAKAYLSQVEKLDTQIKNKLIEKQQWKDIALGITSKMDGDRVQASGRKSKMADAIDKCVDMEAEIDRLIDRLIDTKKDIIAIIEQLESAFHSVYIQYLSFQEIADKYGKSYDCIKQVHKRAIRNIQVIINRRK